MGLKKSENRDYANITVHLSRATLKMMKKYDEVNWSVVARHAFENYVELRQKGDKPPLKVIEAIPDLENQNETTPSRSEP